MLMTGSCGLETTNTQVCHYNVQSTEKIQNHTPCPTTSFVRFVNLEAIPKRHSNSWWSKVFHPHRQPSYRQSRISAIEIYLPLSTTIPLIDLERDKVKHHLQIIPIIHRSGHPVSYLLHPHLPTHLYPRTDTPMEELPRLVWPNTICLLHMPDLVDVHLCSDSIRAEVTTWTLRRVISLLSFSARTKKSESGKKLDVSSCRRTRNWRGRNSRVKRRNGMLCRKSKSLASGLKEIRLRGMNIEL